MDFSWREAGGSFAAAEDLVQDKSPEDLLAAAKGKLDAARPGDDKERAIALLVAVLAYVRLGKVEQAVATALDVRRLLQDVSPGQEEVQVLLLAAAAQVHGGRAEDAVRIAGEAQALARQLGDSRGEASARRLLARAYLASLRPGDALHEATASASLAEAAGDLGAQASACAVAARAQGNTVAAKQLAERAAALGQRAGDRRVEAEGLAALAEVMLTAGDATAALAAAAKAATVAAEAKDVCGQATCLCLEARARASAGDAVAALRAAREALALFRRADDSRGVQRSRDLCASLRGPPTPGLAAAAVAAAAVDLPGAASFVATGGQPWVACTRVCGTAESKRLSGLVAVVTGASEGVGKGSAQMLASAGATVYVTGRAPGQRPDAAAPGSVGETAAALAKLGGVGVAVHADHGKADDNQAVADIVARNHGRLDILVNSVLGDGAAAHGALFAPSLRRGRGLHVDVAGRGEAGGVAEVVADRSVHHMAMAPGIVKSERSYASAQQVGARLIDMESTRFSGQAVAGLAAMGDAELARFSGSRPAFCTAEAARFELDGYSHEAEAQTFATFSRTSLVS